MKRFFFCIMCLFVLGSFTPAVQASYLLPYPSFMPGNRLYRVSRILDQLKVYWYWGNIAQFKYHLNLADKYLVEASTLFNYRQYLLGIKALAESDHEINKLPETLSRAKKEHKDTLNLVFLLQEAMLEHERILYELEKDLPQEFLWQPEKESPTLLPLASLLMQSRNLRVSVRGIR